ncbi:hypothetical protein KAT59_01930 [Candidatus Bipolaricaulota bacterium]|nr:hypothetical protein [Candidatus Bipolaricaulota bacterium]
MVTKRDYNAEQVAAARSVLLELMLVLGEYRNHMVVVGGWVPELLITQPSEPHIGSIDVDLAVDHRAITEAGYRTIRQLLVDRGYEQDDQQPFIFRRAVNSITVEVDLLSGEYGGTGKGRRHQKILDTHLRKARGCDIAFDNPQTIQLEGELPDGGCDTVCIRIASIETFLCMKGMALDGRLKEKDAWDINYCIQQFPGGMDALVESLRPMTGHGLVREALDKIAKHFASPEHRGPQHVADFEEVDDPETREGIQRDTYERVNYVLEQLEIRLPEFRRPQPRMDTDEETTKDN